MILIIQENAFVSSLYHMKLSNYPQPQFEIFHGFGNESKRGEVDYKPTEFQMLIRKLVADDETLHKLVKRLVLSGDYR